MPLLQAAAHPQRPAWTPRAEAAPDHLFAVQQRQPVLAQRGRAAPAVPQHASLAAAPSQPAAAQVHTAALALQSLAALQAAQAVGEPALAAAQPQTAAQTNQVTVPQLAALRVAQAASETLQTAPAVQLRSTAGAGACVLGAQPVQQAQQSGTALGQVAALRHCLSLRWQRGRTVDRSCRAACSGSACLLACIGVLQLLLANTMPPAKASTFQLCS